MPKLLDRLLPLPVILIAIWLLSLGIGPMIPSDSPYVKTKYEIEHLRKAVLRCRAVTGRLPSALSNVAFTRDLEQRETFAQYNTSPFLIIAQSSFNSDHELLDAWGIPFRVYLSKPDQLMIWSAGKDKLWNTEDDIRESLSP